MEHEISIVSAYSLKKKLEDRYKVVMIYIDYQNRVWNVNKMRLDDFKFNRYKKRKKTEFVFHGIKKNFIDCMLLCQHGENGEDGLGAALCRFYHIPYVGSDIMASSIGMDKLTSYRLLSSQNIPMLESMEYSYKDYLNQKKILWYPCIIKPLRGGSSIGIYVCQTEKEFEEKIIKAFEYGKEVLIQPYYESLVEYNLAVYEDGFSRLERIDKKDEIFSFDNKYNESFKLMHQTLEHNSLTKEFEELGRKVYDILRCKGIIRIDFFMIDKRIYVNEVNVLPGALAMYLFEDFKTVIDSCIQKAIRDKMVIYKRGNFLAKSNINK